MTASVVILEDVLSGGVALVIAERNANVGVNAPVIVANKLRFHHAAEGCFRDLPAASRIAPIFIGTIHCSGGDTVALADALLDEIVQWRDRRTYFGGVDNGWLRDHASRGDEQLLDADPHWLLILKPLSMRMIVLEKLLQRALGVLLSADATYQGQLSSGCRSGET
jgi:hypothetical protein